MVDVNSMLISLLQLLLDKTIKLLTVNLPELYGHVFRHVKTGYIAQGKHFNPFFVFAFPTWLKFEFPVILKAGIWKPYVNAFQIYAIFGRVIK